MCARIGRNDDGAMRTLRHHIPVGGAVAAAMLVLPVAAMGETLSLRDARSEVRATSAMAIHSGDATAFRITSCRRVGAAHVHCNVTFRNVRRRGRTCTVLFSVTLRDANFATQPSRPVCRG